MRGGRSATFCNPASLKRQLLGYLILARQEPGCPEPGLGRPWGLMSGCQSFGWSNMDFWPAPGGCPTNGASFSLSKSAPDAGGWPGLAPSPRFSPPGGVYGRGRPAWSSKTRARPLNFLHRLSRLAYALSRKPRRCGLEALGSGSASNFQIPLKGGWPEVRPGLTDRSAETSSGRVNQGPHTGMPDTRLNLKAGHLRASASSSENPHSTVHFLGLF